MSKDYTFSVMPSVSISRSRFARKSQHKTSFNLGQIIPIYCDEVLPGDTRSLDMASLVRMSTPIAPVMDNIFMDYFCFFCPSRLTWVHWKEFMGENSVSAGIPLTTYTIPHVGDALTSAQFAKNSYADYMGLPVGVNSLCGRVSALPFRGLALIYNRWFRNQNIIAPLAVQTGDTDGVLIGANASSFAYSASEVLLASKLPDYFTKALPYAQKGQAVSIPLGSTAPIVVETTINQNAGNYILGYSTSAVHKKVNLGDSNANTLTYAYDTGSYDVTRDTGGYLYADLSNATAATINQLRYAFQLQKFLEKDALYGTRYWEILAAHFGVTAPDASLQDPEYLGGFRQNINIDQVLSTAGYNDDTTQDVGKPGANSVTGGQSSLFTKSFVEHGFIYVIAVARHDQTYTQGINRMWTRNGRYDFYWPVFANLGAQAVLKQEIYATNNASNDAGVFGYQEAWAEYRYKPSIATASMRPTTGNLTFWTLSNSFGSLPTLGKTFIEQGRENIARALVTGLTGPDFICDFYFKDIAVRPMPLYSIPGLIDHH